MSSFLTHHSSHHIPLFEHSISTFLPLLFFLLPLSPFLLLFFFPFSFLLSSFFFSFFFISLFLSYLQVRSILLMDQSKVSALENLLRLPGAAGGSVVTDASVLTCGCLVSELQFADASVCPNCGNSALLLKAVTPLRELYRILQQIQERPRRRSLRRSTRTSEKIVEKTEKPEKTALDMDLMDLFCKYAKEEGTQQQQQFQTQTQSQLLRQLQAQMQALGLGLAHPQQHLPLQRQQLQFLQQLQMLQMLQMLQTLQTLQALHLLQLLQSLPETHQLLQSGPRSTAQTGAQGELAHAEKPRNNLASHQSTHSHSLASHHSLGSHGLRSHQKHEPVLPLMAPRGAEISVSPRDRLAMLRALLGLSDREEYNFLRCFPFHRKVSAFATQQPKLLFRLKKAANFLALALATRVDPLSGAETALFALVADRRWELWLYAGSRPVLAACGRLNGDYGPSASSMRSPAHDGAVVRSDFAGNDRTDTPDDDDVPARLRSWVQLYCCLSDKYLVILGTRGVLRVLNVDPAAGDVGAPVYTYLTNFPIRCIAMAPDSSVVGCGITARERVSGKQQPFVVLHNTAKRPGPDALPAFGPPTTITVPYRDPLKVLAFNAAGTHLLCCTVYEMRYFMVRLRDGAGDTVRRPRLVWSDRRVKRRRRTGSSGSSSDDDTTMHDDDQMLDNEGITDIRFGVPFSNTVVVTSALLQLRPPIVLKLAGATIDRRLRDAPGPDMPAMGDMYGGGDSDSDSDHAVAGAAVLMKMSEVGSNIYRLAVSPRGDALVFVDKLGRLLLAATAGLHGSVVPGRRRVVVLGEAADALRFSEAASVCFLRDGGKIFVVDRKGLFQVFDFTKGVPGEDPDVIKCKIISV